MRQKDIVEDSPRFESTAKHRLHGWDCKRSSNFAKPYQKFIEGCVGQQWNDVYSKLVKKLVGHNNIKEVILHCACNYWVEFNISGFDEDGQPLDSKGRGIGHQELYVDSDGILRKSPKKVRPKVDKPLEYVTIEGQMYGVWNRLWHKLQLKEVPEPHYKQVQIEYGYGPEKTISVSKNMTPPVYDVWHSTYICSPAQSKFRNGMYCTLFSQVGKGILKKIKQHLLNMN